MRRVALKASVLILLILLLMSAGMNMYFLTVHPSVKQPTGSVSLSLATQNGPPIVLSANVQDGYYVLRDLNGTTLATGKIVATAPIDFYITEKGNAGPIAFEALNATNVNIRVPLPKGVWVFGFLSSGVESNVTVAQITLNYSYFE